MYIYVFVSSIYCSFFIYKAIKRYFRGHRETLALVNDVVADNYPEYFVYDEDNAAADAFQQTDKDTFQQTDTDTFQQADSDDNELNNSWYKINNPLRVVDPSEKDSNNVQYSQQDQQDQQNHHEQLVNMFKHYTSYTFPIINTPPAPKVKIL